MSYPHLIYRRLFSTGYSALLGVLVMIPAELTSISLTQAAEPAPVVRWDFGEEESTPLRPHGGVHRDQPGPRPPIYPDFAPDNTAIKLDGAGSYYAFEDPGNESKFDFKNGDEITLEGWIQLMEIRPGENVYVIGKGRTGTKGFAKDNQNWALRVRENGGKAGVNFLFASVPDSSSSGDSHWHRWTSKNGFAAGPAWHHIAISYRFGEPESIRGWIDGRLEEGTWDMGGATKNPPVVDNDAIWIGSSMGGNAGASLRGSLDAIAVYRELISPESMKGRFRRVGAEPAIQPAPEVPPQMDGVPSDRVLITLHEGMPAHDRWLNSMESWPAETMRWTTQAGIFNSLPQRYDSWGIRETWKPPVLLRMAADVSLPAGTHRFLLRTRGLSRLWVGNQLVAKSNPMRHAPNGEEAMTVPASPPFPGARIAEHRQQELFGEATIASSSTVRVVLETLVGAKSFRPDPGETCVAILAADGKSYQLLQPTGAAVLQLTDADVEKTLAHQAVELDELNTTQRRAASTSQDEYWKMRHDAARQWAKAHPAPAIPSGAAGENPIDLFLNQKIQGALAATSNGSLEAARQFHREVLPILRDNCFRCHGEKENGGLLLNSQETARKGGDSGLPAVFPGDLHKSELISRIEATDADERMPPGRAALKPEQIETLKAWITSGADWPAPPVTKEDVAPPPLLSDEAFARRVYLDTIGLVPSEQEIRDFTEDSSADKRHSLVERLLADDRWADHWISYWQDVLAENPTLINSSLNTTGPFRWFLLDALRDNKPFDRLVTELLLLRGSPHDGGSAGFGIAGNNDAPFAAKGQIVAGAFLGIELQCARCHDSPYHSTKQKDLYALAAMFEKKPVTVPASSRVPAAFFEKQQRQSLIKVSLKPDESIPPEWPFAAVTGAADNESIAAFLQDPKDSRQKLAALITAPDDTRFAQVTVNRVWRRFIGAGIVEPPHDWEGHAPSHPQLLAWLAQEFITHDYDLKHISQLILTSQLYQRSAMGNHIATAPELRFFVAPDRRRMTAEQVLDSLSFAGGQKIDSEELTFDPDARRPASNRLTLGTPTRAWMFANLANERDRPSLSLPRARATTDILEAFGWSGARQNPRTDRETAASVLQPGVLANSSSSVLLTRASDRSGLADLAVEAASPEKLVDSIFLRYLSRTPRPEERAPLVAALTVGFDERIVPEQEQQKPAVLEHLPVVTWSNHLRPEANAIALKYEERARTGPPADPRLRTEWRETYEDIVWSVVNLGEFVWVP